MADWLRLKFPALQSLPTVIAGRLDLGTLLQLNDTLVRDSKAFKKLEPDAKLAQNVELCASTPTVVSEGLDNRKTSLHETRFLGGGACSAQTIWIRARELLGNEGVPALGGYDMDAVGCQVSVTPKGWLELHNPASTSISLKMFHMASPVWKLAARSWPARTRRKPMGTLSGRPRGLKVRHVRLEVFNGNGLALEQDHQRYPGFPQHYQLLQVRSGGARQ